MAISEVIYKGRDNTIDLQLSSDSGIADLSGVTKIELVDSFGRTATISSADHSDWFDTTEGGGILKISLGMADLSIGKSYTFEIILYDTDNTNGINWGQFMAVVR